MLNSLYQKDYRNWDFPFNARLSLGGASFQWHWHEEFEILLCVEDLFTVGLENHFYPFEKDDIMIVLPNQMHCDLPSPSTKHLVIKFSPLLLKGSPADFSAFTSKDLISLNWQPEDRQKIREIVWKIWEEYDSKRQGYQSVICRYLYEIQAYAIRCLPQASSETSNQISSGNKQNCCSSSIRPVLLYISQHYTEHLTLSECAEHFSFNTNYFSTFFAHSTGITFYKYLQTLRLREFEHLLTTTADSITELCFKAGFSSIKTLNRMFHDTWGISPTQYRANFNKSRS